MNLEKLSKAATKPWFLAVFNGGLVGLWVTFGVDVSNIFISIVTAEIVLLGYGADSRRAVATQAKLDEIIHATKGARADLEHIEDMAEEEIAERRV